MLILGIDPGLSGALALLNTETGGLTVDDVPVFEGKKTALNMAELSRLIDAAQPSHAFIEEVHARQGEGPVGAFSFGQVYGSILGIVAANFVPLTLVSPRAWKAFLKVPKSGDADKAKAYRENKELARQHASHLLPRHSSQWNLKKHSDRAEAALIALYGARQLGISA